jgi:hypothetical protein
LTQFSLTPYYRSYFGKKQRLAFVEGFGMINSEKKQQVIQNMINQNYYRVEGRNYTDCPRFWSRRKMDTKRGFIFEINAGIGRIYLTAIALKL